MPCCGRRNFDDSKWMAANSGFPAGGFPGDETVGWVHGAGVWSREDLAGPGDGSGGTRYLPAYGCGRESRDGLEGIRTGADFVQRRFHESALYFAAGTAVGMAALESAEVGGRARGAGLQHSGFVYDQY